METAVNLIFEQQISNTISPPKSLQKNTKSKDGKELEKLYNWLIDGLPIITTIGAINKLEDKPSAFRRLR